MTQEVNSSVSTTPVNLELPLPNGVQSVLDEENLRKGILMVSRLMTDPLDQYVGVDLAWDESVLYRTLGLFSFTLVRSYWQFVDHEIGHSFVDRAVIGETEFAFSTSSTLRFIRANP